MSSVELLEQVRLPPLMLRTSGSPGIRVGLIDGQVLKSHPDLAGSQIQAIGDPAACEGFACVHGTFVAGILAARRGSSAPGICPDCTLLVRPIFSADSGAPSASPSELAEAIRECVAEGAHIVNLSAALRGSSKHGDSELYDALSHAAARGAMVVAAAGNDGNFASSAITRHPWVIPVVAYSRAGRPMGLSNLCASIGRSGLGAPGENIVSLGARGGAVSFSGTSAATPFVTGAIALLRSEFPAMPAERIRHAAVQAFTRPRRSVVPPLLDAWGAYEGMR